MARPRPQFGIGALMTVVAAVAVVMAALARSGLVAALVVVNAGHLIIDTIVHSRLRMRCRREGREPSPEDRAEAEERSMRLRRTFLVPSLLAGLAWYCLRWTL